MSVSTRFAPPFTVCSSSLPLVGIPKTRTEDSETPGRKQMKTIAPSPPDAFTLVLRDWLRDGGGRVWESGNEGPF